MITVLNQKELWYVPPVDEKLPVEPLLLAKLPENALGIAEAEANVFYFVTSNMYTSHEGFLHRLDLRGWIPGSAIEPETVLKFPEQARGLNGMCMLAPNVLLVADCFAGQIWRVDLDPSGGQTQISKWLSHASMDYFPGALKPEQPGVNGVRYAARTSFLYYTGTAKKLLMRVSVDANTQDARGEPELVVAGRMGDDFCIDEDAGFIYLATHRQNTIDRVSMIPADNSGFTESVAGNPFTEELIGPSAGVWGRRSGDYGHVAYFVTDGGTASPPPDGIARPAKVLRVEL